MKYHYKATRTRVIPWKSEIYDVCPLDENWFNEADPEPYTCLLLACHKKKDFDVLVINLKRQYIEDWAITESLLIKNESLITIILDYCMFPITSKSIQLYASNFELLTRIPQKVEHADTDKSCYWRLTWRRSRCDCMDMKFVWNDSHVTNTEWLENGPECVLGFLENS